MKLFSKKSRILKSMDYASDQNGIIDRYFKEKEGWRSHLDRSKQYIIDFIDDKSGTVAIFGSGWLLDLPIDELSHKFDKIYLVDIIQPPQIKHLLKDYNNFILIETDITGGLVEEVYKLTRQARKKRTIPELSSIAITDVQFDKPVDCFISINILSQLNGLLNEYLEKHFTIKEESFQLFGKKIQEKHIQYLKTKPSCLITDYEEWNFDQSVNKITTKQLLHADIAENETVKHWDWLFDMAGNYNPNKRTILKVKAITF